MSVSLVNPQNFPHVVRQFERLATKRVSPATDGLKEQYESEMRDTQKPPRSLHIVAARAEGLLAALAPRITFESLHADLAFYRDYRPSVLEGWRYDSHFTYGQASLDTTLQQGVNSAALHTAYDLVSALMKYTRQSLENVRRVNEDTDRGIGNLIKQTFAPVPGLALLEVYGAASYREWEPKVGDRVPVALASLTLRQALREMQSVQTLTQNSGVVEMVKAADAVNSLLSSQDFPLPDRRARD
jgi:hypothetical protein